MQKINKILADNISQVSGMLSRDHDGYFPTFLRRFYFPVLVRFASHICVIWLAIFIVSLVYGPRFLSSTRQSEALPPGAPSKEAIHAFDAHYSGVSRLNL